VTPWIAEFTAWSAFFVTWMVAGLWAARPAARAGMRAQWLYLALTVPGFYLLLQPADFGSGPLLWQTSPALAWAMVAFSSAGFAFCWWARLHLGALWSGTVTRKEGHRIVDTGPYGLVRHPIYTGILAACIGQAVIAATLGAIAGAVLVTVGHIVKARLEERFLKTELGAAPYEAYARRTPMLIPWPRPGR
jgi:protein-S-isoprenylcysteine O-methyltransferase Ste14